MPDYPKEQLWELYKSLPKELQKAMYSEEVAKNIQEICRNNGVTNDDIIFDIAKNIGSVFLGLLPPNEFSDVLEKELEIEKAKAKKITSEIIRFVFLPVKKSLEGLYKIEIKPGINAEARALTEEAKKPEKAKKKIKKSDKYREITE